MEKTITNKTWFTYARASIQCRFYRVKNKKDDDCAESQ